MGQPDVTGETRALASFVSALEYDSLPDAAIDAAKWCVLDQIGVALFGAALPWCRIVQDMVAAEDARPVARVWGTSLRTSPALAALANGTAGHAFEIDDLHMASGTHPGAVVLPAVLATAERLGGVTGKDALVAIVAGYEVCARVGMSLSMTHFMRGFHPQGTVGTFGAAAAAGRLLRLSADQMTHAFGIAGSQSAGLMAAQEGGMVKRLHSGRAAQSGVYAAELASRGFTGIENVVEAKYGGLISSMGGDPEGAPKLVAGLGDTFEIANIGFKTYASCATVHTSLEAVRQLIAEHGLRREDISDVLARVTTDAWVHSGWEYRANDVIAAQMSLKYGIAAMLVDGRVFADQFTDERIKDPLLLETARLVRVEPDPELDALGWDRRYAASVEITTHDGRRLHRRVDERPGGPTNPVSRQELTEKFEALVRSVGRASQVQPLRETVFALERLPSIDELARQLASPVGEQEALSASTSGWT